MILESYVAGSTPEFTIEGHFFPHYAPGDSPVISKSGDELAPIGPDWALITDDYDLYFEFVEEFGFPNLNPQVPIPCP